MRGLTNDEVSVWVAALRSDEYPQGRGAMCRETQSGPRWDPLGVLVNEIWEGDWVRVHDGDLWGIETPELCWTRPPESVSKVSRYLMTTIVRQNDVFGWTFRAIADWIEIYHAVLTKGAE